MNLFSQQKNNKECGFTYSIIEQLLLENEKCSKCGGQNTLIAKCMVLRSLDKVTNQFQGGSQQA